MENVMRKPFASLAPLFVAIAGTFAAGHASAQVVFNKKTISTEAAEKITTTCLDWFQSHSARGKPTVWVLNANGDTIYVKRVDGANRVGVETARMKAQSALYLFRPTRTISNFAKTPSGAPSPGGEAMLVLLNGYISAGGLPIVVDGEVVGAVGVGGLAPDQAQGVYPDEQCAQAGIDAVFKK
jgi:glc operon protein GlcG